MMHRITVLGVALFLFHVPASAQRDPPVWESYLDRIAVYHPDRLSTSIDFVWEKNGGAHEHKEHQVYLLAYLEKNEREILALMDDSRLMTKGAYEKEDGTKTHKKILEVLLEKKLVTVLASPVATRIDHALNDADPKTSRRGNAFPFAFEFQNKDLFERVRQLSGLDAKVPERVQGTDSYKDWFKEDFKLMPFIPANDCEYADKVKPENKTSYDFTYGEGYGGKQGKIAQYMRPLPYVFNFARLWSGEVLVYVH